MKLRSAPLYKLVKESILTRIAEGEWAPGSFLPSEPVLAEEYDVSHGTLRRALDELTRERRLVRYQGKGTAVALLDSDRALFQFFQIFRENGDRVLPTSKNLSIELGAGRTDGANAEEAAALLVSPGERVIRIERVRLIDGVPVFSEYITLPASRFPQFQDVPPTKIPNTLYDFFQTTYGVTIAHAKECLTAVAASKQDAIRLHVEPGTPLLAISRISYDIKNSPVELRKSNMMTNGFYYYSEFQG